MTPYGYALGWNPNRAPLARQEMLASGRYARVSPFDLATLPSAWSISRFRLRHLEQGQAGTCFPPGARVRMADGSQRKIEDIRLLDQVLTAGGLVAPVAQLHVRRYQGPLVCLKLWGHSHLTMTPNHPIVTRRGKVAAEDLTSDDWVAFPRYAPQAVKVIQTNEHIRTKERLVVGRHIHEPVVRLDRCNSVPDFVELTPRAGRLFGMYLAEGSACNNHVVWSFGAEKKAHLADEVTEILREDWGIIARREELFSRNVIKIRVDSILLARLFDSLFCNRAENKKLHPDLMGGPEDFLRAMFEGWMDCDGSAGSLRRNGTRIGATISHDLAISMFDIANFLGMRPAILREKAQVNRYAKIRQPVWKIGLVSGADNYRVELESGVMWRKVRSVDQRINHDGFVYNLGVDEDSHTYVVEGINCSNCWEHAATQLVETSANAMGYEAFPICRRLVGWQGKKLEGGGNQVDGGNPTDALMGMTDSDKGVGIAHEDLDPYPHGDTNQMRAALAPKPPASVFEDAKASHLIMPVDVRSNDDARALIAANHGCSTGHWWPFGWDDQQTFMTTIGQGTYGHALYEIGYVLPGVFDEYAYWQIDNWHGLLYPPLSADKAAKVPGYMPITPDRTSDFWVRDDVYQQVKDMGNFEHVSATDVNGIKKNIVETNWDGILI